MARTHSTLDGQGMMGGQAKDQMSGMSVMHEAMAQSGTCDPELMQSMHE
jgi:hypothetical protein